MNKMINKLWLFLITLSIFHSSTIFAMKRSADRELNNPSKKQKTEEELSCENICNLPDEIICYIIECSLNDHQDLQQLSTLSKVNEKFSRIVNTYFYLKQIKEAIQIKKKNDFSFFLQLPDNPKLLIKALYLYIYNEIIIENDIYDSTKTYIYSINNNTTIKETIDNIKKKQILFIQNETAFGLTCDDNIRILETIFTIIKIYRIPLKQLIFGRNSNFSFVGLKDSVIFSLLQDLQVLYIRNNTLLVIPDLSENKKLKLLNISNNEHLKIHPNDLKKLSHIETIDFSNNENISTINLEEFKNLKKIKNLGIINCGFSEEQISTIKSYLPNTKIFHNENDQEKLNEIIEQTINNI